jgi:hypothetical protein
VHVARTPRRVALQAAGFRPAEQSINNRVCSKDISRTALESLASLPRHVSPSALTATQYHAEYATFCSSLVASLVLRVRVLGSGSKSARAMAGEEKTSDRAPKANHGVHGLGFRV